MIYYFTFGQEHPLRDCWIEIIAPNAHAARLYVVSIFGQKFAFQYGRESWSDERFPGGRAGCQVEVNEDGEFLRMTTGILPQF